MISGSSLADGGDPAPLVDASFQPALQGHVRAGVFAEVGVRLVSRRDGTARIDGAGSNGRSSTSITLRAGQPRSIWLPYRADLTEPLVFRVLFEGTVVQVHEMRSIRPASPRVPLVIAASARKSDRRADSRFGGVGAIRIGVADLPRTLQGYDPVAGLVLDVSVLTRLDGPQLSALEAFIADYGRLTIADLPERAKPKIQKIAGCSGALVRFTTRTLAMDMDTGPGLHTEKLPLPSATDLAALAPDEDGGTAFIQLGIFFGAYALLMVIAAFAGRPIPSLLMTIGTAAVALLLWTGRAPGVSSVLWLESQPGQERARFAAVVGFRGQGLSVRFLDEMVWMNSEAVWLFDPLL